MSFHDIVFPIDISLQSSGGPVWRTEIVSLSSGHEQRNGVWAGSRRRYDAGYGIKALEQLETVIAFFEARAGRLHSFRWRDPFDHQSAPFNMDISEKNQLLGTGNGIQTQFQLKKLYTSGPVSYERVISKPVKNTIKISCDDQLIDENEYSIDYLSGIVTFLNPPENETILKVGFAFDVPVRFDSESLNINISAWKSGSIVSIPIIEVLS